MNRSALVSNMAVLFSIVCVASFIGLAQSSPSQKISPPAVAPTDTGSLAGTVEDHHGVPVGGATVTVESLDGHKMRSGNTDGMGSFSFENLPVGEYMVTATARGLLSKTEKVRVKDRRRTTLHFKLKAPPVDGESST